MQPAVNRSIYFTVGSSPARLIRDIILLFPRSYVFTGNSSSMVERFIVVEDTSVRFCGFALY